MWPSRASPGAGPSTSRQTPWSCGWSTSPTLWGRPSTWRGWGSRAGSGCAAAAAGARPRAGARRRRGTAGARHAVDPELEAVIFDVDGTIADTERHGHRVAFNLAFERLGLPHRWGEEDYGRLLETPGGEHRLKGYLTAQGLAEERAAALAKDLHRLKQAIFLDLMRQGAAPLRPGIDRLLDELAAAAIRVAVATTAGRTWVGDLRTTLLGAGRGARF